MASNNTGRDPFPAFARTRLIAPKVAVPIAILIGQVPPLRARPLHLHHALKIGAIIQLRAASFIFTHTINGSRQPFHKVGGERSSKQWLHARLFLGHAPLPTNWNQDQALASFKENVAPPPSVGE